jgi:hypothetical protein
MPNEPVYRHVESMSMFYVYACARVVCACSRAYLCRSGRSVECNHCFRCFSILSSPQLLENLPRAPDLSIKNIFGRNILGTAWAAYCQALEHG